MQALKLRKLNSEHLRPDISMIQESAIVKINQSKGVLWYLIPKCLFYIILGTGMKINKHIDTHMILFTKRKCCEYIDCPTSMPLFDNTGHKSSRCTGPIMALSWHIIACLPMACHKCMPNWQVCHKLFRSHYPYPSHYNISNQRLWYRENLFNDYVTKEFPNPSP